MVSGTMAMAQENAASSGSGQPRLVLVADGNTGRGQRLVDECTAAGFVCRLAPHGAAALEVALAVQPAVVVAQLDLPLVDALKLGEILRANPRTRAARFVFLGPGDRLGSRGAVGDCLLAADARPAEIVSNIEQLLDRQGRIDNFDAVSDASGCVDGELGDLPLTDLLHSLLLQRRSGLVTLVDEAEGQARQQGRILVRDGDVIQAEVGQVDGEKALFRILTWRVGCFRFEPGRRDEPPAILAPTRRLLMEGLRQVDEWDRLATQLPALDSPIKLTIKNSELPNIVHPLTQEVLLLLELYGTVREVVDHCAFPDYQVLRTLHTLAERGIVQLGRVPMPAAPTRPAAEGLFNEAQARRLRDWLLDTGADKADLPDAKLLVVASSAEATPDFAALLAGVPGVELSDEARRPGGLAGRLVKLGRIAVDDEIGIELIHLPKDDGYAAFWPVAGHGALGTLYLLSGAMGEAAAGVERVARTLGRLSRARTFHVVLLGKEERLAPDELRENLSLIDEASLFLLPIESGKDPAALLRSLFARVIP